MSDDEKNDVHWDCSLKSTPPMQRKTACGVPVAEVLCWSPFRANATCPTCREKARIFRSYPP